VKFEYLIMVIAFVALGMWALAAADCADRGGVLVRAPVFGLMCVEPVK
jgi:hypothetical protein